MALVWFWWILVWIYTEGLQHHIVFAQEVPPSPVHIDNGLARWRLWFTYSQRFSSRRIDSCLLGYNAAFWHVFPFSIFCSSIFSLFDFHFLLFSVPFSIFYFSIFNFFVFHFHARLKRILKENKTNKLSISFIVNFRHRWLCRGYKADCRYGSVYWTPFARD